jgi:molybdenum cofactor cytidylyltransferase
VRFVANDDADRGQLSSVIVGVNAADHPGVTAVLITPVDVPLIRPSTIRALLTTMASRHASVVRATYRGAHGHPVVFSRSVFDELRHAHPEIGAKSVVRAHANDLINVEVDDPGVVKDIDRPEDYAAEIGPRT